MILRGKTPSWHSDYPGSSNDDDSAHVAARFTLPSILDYAPDQPLTEPFVPVTTIGN
ncbi:MAG: hypothetical protein AB1752_03530 [Candidatus Zixiibacteriota bacterium]